MYEPSKREWGLYVDDMLKAAQRVREYSTGKSQAEFIDSSLHFDATVRNLEIIGEAATHIPEDIRIRYPKLSPLEIG